MKSLLLVLLSLCSPISTQESSDYIDVVAPYPNRGPAHDRRAQSFLSGSHSPDAMKMFANMLYNYLKGVAVPHKNEEDYEQEDAHLKARNLELVQDAFEKSSLRHLATPPPPYQGPPLPLGPPPPPTTSFDDYDIGAPGLPPVESDRPPPPPMPKFRPIRYEPGLSSPIPPSPTPPSRVLLFKPSSMRQRPDEFIVRPPPHTRFNSPDGKMPYKSAAAPILSINQMPYRRPFFIPLPPYSPPAHKYRQPPVTPYPVYAYRYRTDSRVEARRNPSVRKQYGGYVLPPQQKENEKRLYSQLKMYPRRHLPSTVPYYNPATIPHGSKSIRGRERRKNR